MESNLKGMEESITGHLRALRAPLGVVYVSSYIPRKCGIATFTKYLTTAVNLLNPLKPAQIITLNNKQSRGITYPHESIIRINDDDIRDYKKAARYINRKKDIDVVNIQHEFGIYGPNQGELVMNFIRMIKKPVVTTIHSMRTDFGENRVEILNELYERSTYVVVMLDAVKEMMAKVLNKDGNKIVVIHHGVLDFPKIKSPASKKKLRMKGKVVMSSINLLSKWKGIEYAISAVPDIVKKIPNFLYLVIGETHPSHIREDGYDEYRTKLENLVAKLKMEKHVRFINKYVTVSEQKQYIDASDFYVTPYLDPQQSSSGALAFAIGAGKVCISTPNMYAREMLSRGKGILVPFSKPKAIAKAVINANNNPEKMEWYQNEAYEQGRLMTWVNVAHQYFHLFQTAKDIG